MIDYNLSSILESKKTYRKKLANMPIAEKLLMIEKMRERDKSIAKSRQALAEKLKFDPSPGPTPLSKTS